MAEQRVEIVYMAWDQFTHLTLTFHLHIQGPEVAILYIQPHFMQ